jgi:GTPase SAR1 family protein
LLKEHAEEDVRIVLVGNKIDFVEEKREVTTKEAKELADSYNISYFEISVKENIGLDDCWMDLLRGILENYKKGMNESKFINIDYVNINERKNRNNNNNNNRIIIVLSFIVFIISMIYFTCFKK